MRPERPRARPARFTRGIAQRLTPDNLTPPTRTPWGGLRIAGHYKAGLGLNLPPGSRVGEAWEVSVEPSFPSRLAESGERLDACIAADPIGWLGEAVAKRFDGQLPLLLKLLDAAQDLSVQVHPADDDPALDSGESGKPEAWIILDAAPDAGIFLGWREGVTRATVEDCLAAQGELDALMNFVPVRRGEVYVVDAGVAHAIGAGVSLVEPQQVLPGRRGVTYRFWDWNRRYDERGRPCSDGSPRELQVERALAVTRWDTARGEAFVDACRREPKRLEGRGALMRDQLIEGPHFAVERWQGSGRMRLESEGFLGIVCVGGSLALGSEPRGGLRLRMGQSGVVPACVSGFELEAEDLEAYAARPLA